VRAALVGACILLIALSLGVVLYVRAELSLAEAGLAAMLAGLLLVTLQAATSRARERAELRATIDDLRAERAQSAERNAEFDERVDAAEARITGLEEHMGGALVENLDARIAAQVAAAKASLISEMQVIESLVKQLAENVAPPRSGAIVPGGDEGTRDATDTPLGHLDDADILAMVRRSIEANRIDIYLQPIVTLPQRRARYYEALTRLRNDEGEVIFPVDYLRVAEPAGIMPLIDNVLLFRSVQIVRSLAQRNRELGIFCNISAHSLVDPDFFPQFVDFMEHNKALSNALVFEFSQSIMNAAGPLEAESFLALREHGFRFSMDHVTNLDFDLKQLARFGFRFVKVDANILLYGGEQLGAQIHAADLSKLLARNGMQLIAEKIESEQTVIELLDFDVAFGQGYLFSEPRPVRSELLGEVQDQKPLRKAV